MSKMKEKIDRFVPNVENAERNSERGSRIAILGCILVNADEIERRLQVRNDLGEEVEM